MLNATAAAHALTILVTGLYVGFHVLGLLSPRAFVFLFNAQFFGADAASLLPKDFSLGDVLGTLLALAGTSWILGYVGVRLYNRLAA